MKKIILSCLVIFTLASCQQSDKIGFVDNSKLINEYQEKKDIEIRLQAKIGQFQKRTDSLRQAFQLEINDAEIKARRMSTSEKQALSKELQDKDNLLAQRLQFEQQQINLESQALNDSLIARVKQFVKDYASKNGYSYILGSNEGGSVLFGKEESDLTQTVLDLMNAEYESKQ
jgi:outer membrane protein